MNDGKPQHFFDHTAYLTILTVKYWSANPLRENADLRRCDDPRRRERLGISSILHLLLEGIGSVLARYTFVLHSSPRPTVFPTWLIVPGIVVHGGAANASLPFRR
ncbi:MAG TPA: hypothetical protein VGD96_23725 [Bradyrhizobium sp.]